MKKIRELLADLFHSYKEPAITWFVEWPFQNPDKLIIIFFVTAVVYSAIKYL